MATIATIAAKLHLPPIGMFVLPSVFCTRQKQLLAPHYCPGRRVYKVAYSGGGLASCDLSAPGIGSRLVCSRPRSLMSALGQKQTSAECVAMSALDLANGAARRCARPP